MTQIALALHYYHDEFGADPPFTQRGADGRALYSWRLLVAKHFRPDMLERLDLNAAWDEPPNREVLAEFDATRFRCPVHEDSAPATYALKSRRAGDRRELVLVESECGEHWAAPCAEDGQELPREWRNSQHGEFSQYLVLGDRDLGTIVRAPNPSD